MKRIVVCLLLLSLLACVPTPEEEVVVNKADGVLENIIHATPEPVTTTWTMPTKIETNTPSPDAAEIPMKTEHWTDSFSVAAAMDRLDVTIDADVQVPEINTSPVLRIGFAAPESAQIEALIKTFLGNGTIYQAETVKTKAYYKAQMERYLAEKEKETDERNLEEWDLLLSKANESYAKAPDDMPPVEWNGSTEGGIDLMSENGDGTYRYLRADKVRMSYQDAPDTPYLLHAAVMKTAPETDEETAAVALCEDTLKALGIDAEFSELCEAQSAVRAFGERTIDGYLVCFMPKYHSLPVTAPRLFNGFDEAIHAAGGSTEPSYSIHYEEETIEFAVENGAVVSFRYIRPSRVIRTENDAAQLLEFYRIKELFKKDIGKVMFVNKGQPMKLHVHTVRLTMKRYPIKDTADELYLLPCWEFLASVETGNGAATDQTLQNVCVLRLNALDGSIL